MAREIDASLKKDLSSSAEIVRLLRFVMGGVTAQDTGEMWTYDTGHYTYSVTFADDDTVKRISTAPKLSKRADEALLSRLAR